jgi:hypothetical protein
MSLMILSGALVMTGIVGGAALIGPIGGLLIALFGLGIIPLYEVIEYEHQRKEKNNKMRIYPPYNY